MKIFISLIMTSLIVLSSCSGKSTDLEDMVTNSWTKNNDLLQVGFEGVGLEPNFAFRFTNGTLNWQEDGKMGADSYSATWTSTIVEENQNVVIEAWDFSAILNPDNCSDGVTENEYNYSVVVKKDSREFTWCARDYSK